MVSAEVEPLAWVTLALLLGGASVALEIGEELSSEEELPAAEEEVSCLT